MTVSENRSSKLPIALLACSALYIVLRLSYWSITTEFPFSDMEHFEIVARNVLNHFDFGLDSFWRSYKPPILPLLRATQILLWGDTLVGWRIFLLFFSLGGLLWLAREVRLATGSRWLPIALVAVAAVSKSSIFWSLKVATEGVAESFFYYTIAVGLYTLRAPSVRSFVIAGIVMTTALFNRPNFALSFPLFAVWFLFLRQRAGGRLTPTSLSFKRYIFLFCVFSVVVVGIWTPWLVRSYRMYGGIVPLNTSGPLTFIYGWWNVEAENEQGEMVQTTWREIMDSAESRFSNDYELYRWTAGVAKHWIEQNWRQYPELLQQRFVEGIVDRDVQLTKVSRQRLFPGPANSFLIDKSFWAVISGAVGLLIMPFVFGASMALFGLYTVPYYFFSILFQGNPRFLEPIIPLLMFGNTVWVFVGIAAVKRVASREQNGRWLEYCVASAACIVAALFLHATTLTAVTVPLDVKLGNVGFEDWNDAGPVDWVIGGDGTGRVTSEDQQVFAGAADLRVSDLQKEMIIYQDAVGADLNKVGGKDFSVSVWVKADTPDAVHLALADGVKWFHSEAHPGGNWEQLTLTGEVSDQSTQLRVHVYVRAGGAEIDEASLVVNDYRYE